MPTLAFIAMVPMRILECWLLGDEKGFEYMGCLPQNPALPKDSELIWGEKNDVNSDYPKHYLERILMNCGYPNDTATFKLIVCNNDFNRLSKNCPRSFPTFYENIIKYKNNKLGQIERNNE